MIRTLSALAIALAVLAVPAAAEEPKQEKPTVELRGEVKDDSLEPVVPSTQVILTQEAWEKLVKAWSIKDAPKVDFTKELLVVGTWKGSVFSVTPTVKDGDLTISAGGTKDLRPGFRWHIVSVKREGIKTINGKPIGK